jgi:L-threonylcarbamoyladenylate synthase
VRELGAPITGTSANRSGKPGLTTARAVLEEFGDEIDLVIDGGETPGGVASTVLDLSGERPRILRQGAVARREIEELCGVGV